MNADEAIRVGGRGAVAVLTIDRPAVRSALDDAGWLEPRDRLRAASADRAVRVVVVTGSGERAFCAGMDPRQVGRGGEEVLAASAAYHTAGNPPAGAPPEVARKESAP
jgi:enoyl-CoA hydratase/carnithine racemase